MMIIIKHGQVMCTGGLIFHKEDFFRKCDHKIFIQDNTLLFIKKPYIQNKLDMNLHLVNF